MVYSVINFTKCPFDVYNCRTHFRVIGSFIILRGMSLMGDAISHAVLPGVAVSYMFGFNYIFGASIFGLLAALSIGFITQKVH